MCGGVDVTIASSFRSLMKGIRPKLQITEECWHGSHALMGKFFIGMKEHSSGSRKWWKDVFGFAASPEGLFVIFCCQEQEFSIRFILNNVWCEIDFSFHLLLTLLPNERENRELHPWIPHMSLVQPIFRKRKCFLKCQMT